MQRIRQWIREHLSAVSIGLMLLGIALLLLSIWGFIKGSRAGMSARNGSAFTGFVVSVRWLNMFLGAAGAVGGFVLLRKADAASDTDDYDEPE
ncbi:MAG: hypothetical protein II875_14430 [Clostridia bacterium]|nr:hypothetical protein [Clostridia bacterium]